MMLVLSMFLISQNVETPHKVLKFECKERHNSTSWREVNFDYPKMIFAIEDEQTRVKCAGWHTPGHFKIFDRNVCHSCNPSGRGRD
jgi:hypothetical protein